jgi:hypothetical protein
VNVDRHRRETSARVGVAEGSVTDRMACPTVPTAAPNTPNRRWRGVGSGKVGALTGPQTPAYRHRPKGLKGRGSPASRRSRKGIQYQHTSKVSTQDSNGCKQYPTRPMGGQRRFAGASMLPLLETESRKPRPLAGGRGLMTERRNTLHGGRLLRTASLRANAPTTS